MDSVFYCYLKCMTLANRSNGQTNEVLVNCFVGKLHKDIRRDVMTMTVFFVGSYYFGKKYRGRNMFLTMLPFVILLIIKMKDNSLFCIILILVMI